MVKWRGHKSAGPRPAARAILALFALGVAAGLRSPAAAQIDYRNLDEGRPVRTEDAYPVEHYAFELVLPYEYENEAGDARLHVVAPELSYGLLPDFMIGVKLPFAVHDEGAASASRGFGGPRLFGFYNFNTESGALPAFAFRADLALPLGGELAGERVRVGLTAIATRSWGRTRAHLNGTLGLGSDAGASAVDGVPEWAATLAVDRTVLRRSLLLIAEAGAREEVAGAPTTWSAGAGARMQLTPTFVVDAGFERRLSDGVGPDLRLTIGLSHAFAIAGFLPGGR